MKATRTMAEIIEINFFPDIKTLIKGLQQSKECFNKWLTLKKIREPRHFNLLFSSLSPVRLGQQLHT